MPSSSSECGKRTRTEFDIEPTEPSAAAKVLLKGAYDEASIRVGEAYQALVPPLVESSTEIASRSDVPLALTDEPLASPPPLLPQSSTDLSEIVKAAAAAAAAKAAEAATAEAAEAAEAAQDAKPPPDHEDDDEDSDYDDEGNPRLPAGVSVGDACLAMGLAAGERRLFKGTLLAVRKSAPHLLVRYIANETGEKTPRLQLPEILKAALHRREVRAWLPPDERQSRAPPGQAALRGCVSGTAGEAGATSGSTAPLLCEWEQRQSRTLRVRADQPLLPPLITVVGGLQLHLDPLRKDDNYAGTGYLGVDIEYQGAGAGQERPYVVTFDGGHVGRFATAEQAAVHFARLEAGLPVDPAAAEHAQPRPKAQGQKKCTSGLCPPGQRCKCFFSL